MISYPNSFLDVTYRHLDTEIILYCSRSFHKEVGLYPFILKRNVENLHKSFAYFIITILA